MKTRLWTAALALAVMSWPRASAAEQPLCSGAINRSNLTACALSASPSLRAELSGQFAAEARREAARPFLPSNPTLSGSVSSRVGPTDRATNWNIAIGQELEVAGQSWLRVEAAEDEVRAQAHRVRAIRQEVAALAWSAYFTVLAVQERLRLAIKLEEATVSVAATVRAMATHGLTSEIDADIAETSALKASTERYGLEGALASARARLNRVTDGPAEVTIEGALDPLIPQAVPSQQPALLALEEQLRAAERRVVLLQRERVPNPTVSLFAQNDGFEERVLGIGLSIPVPLPQPLGRTGAGQIDEAKALAGRARAESERIRRELQAELTAATADFAAASKTRQLYPLERVRQATARLDSIAAQVKAARLPVRDALLGQQALVEQLKAEIDAREALCLASVRLARAAGTSLEGDSL